MTIESREQASHMAMRTPCCNVPYGVDYVYEGRPYMQEQVVDSFDCSADGCDNTWRSDGSPWMIFSETADESGHREMFIFEEDED